jgi:hypothetical protein
MREEIRHLSVNKIEKSTIYLMEPCSRDEAHSFENPAGKVNHTILLRFVIFLTKEWTFVIGHLAYKSLYYPALDDYDWDSSLLRRLQCPLQAANLFLL